MAANQSASILATIGPLSRTNHTNQQEFAADIAANLIITQQTPPKAEDGKDGKDGTLITQNVTTITIEQNAQFVDTSVNLETGATYALVNTNTAETPTVGISSVRGTIAYFTAAIPTANYKISVTKYTISTPES